MRILQLIDTLSPGGAERMAVNFANSLAAKIDFSGLVSTRLEGNLKSKISTKVLFNCLYKKHALDLFALHKLYRFANQNQIEIVHAHGTTFFTAFLLKCIRLKTKIIYHEHFGNRVSEGAKQNIFLKICSIFFTEIIVVNLDLKYWCEKYLNCKKVTFLPNFASFENEEKKTTLAGTDGKRIVMLANLKHPKNHLFVVQAFSEMLEYNRGWSLHLVGKNFHDEYSKEIMVLIKERQNSNSIFIYDSCSDVQNVLSQASIGILASTSEGFPVTILEYAKMKLAVISTNVGYCASLINDGQTGFLFHPNDNMQFKLKLQNCISNDSLRTTIAANLQKNCQNHYSETVVLNLLLSIYSKTVS